MQRAIAQWRASSLQKLRAATTVTTTFTRDITSTADKADAGMDASATELAGMATELAGMAAAGADVVEYHGPRRKYDAMIARGELRQDAHQALTVDQLERVYQDLVANRRNLSSSGSGLTLVDASGTQERRSGWWGSIVGSLHDDAPLVPVVVARHHPRAVHVRGPGVRQDHAHGHVCRGAGRDGAGKREIFEGGWRRPRARLDPTKLPPPPFQTRRVHYHDFMLDVHVDLCRAPPTDALARSLRSTLYTLRSTLYALCSLAQMGTTRMPQGSSGGSNQLPPRTLESDEPPPTQLEHLLPHRSLFF